MDDYKPFPTDCLPDAVGRFVAATSDAIQIDPAFIAVPALPVLASAIGTTREVELKHGWCEPSVLWSCTIARSGTCKSPAMEAALKPLADAEHEAQLENQAAASEHEIAVLHHEKAMLEWRKGKGGGDPPQKPTEPAHTRYIVSDVTIEALAPLLKRNERGLLSARDELSGWFRGFDRYSKGKGGDSAGWLEVYRAGRLSVDRRTSGTIYIPRAAVSVTGTIQPGIFAAAMAGEHMESGLAARLLVARPPTQPKKFSQRFVSAHITIAYAETIRTLLKIPHIDDGRGPEPLRMPLAVDARSEWAAWYDRHAMRQHEAAEDAQAAALAKIEGAAARFALIFALVADPYANEVSADAIHRGCTLADWFSDEADRVYARLWESDVERDVRRLEEWIDRNEGGVTIRDVTHGLRQFKGKPEEAEAALGALVDAGRLRRVQSSGPGRPTERYERVPAPPKPKPPAFSSDSAGYGDGDNGDNGNGHAVTACVGAEDEYDPVTDG